MTSLSRNAGSTSPGMAITIGVAAMISLAIAMGVGRFAFTPLFPLMVRDGLLTTQNGTLLAASNYLGYLMGALLAGQVRLRPSLLLALGLLSTVAVTGAVGCTSSLAAWTTLRFAAGVLSAWTLVATSAWALGWLAVLRQHHFAGIIFSGVGLGITAVGVFCVLAARAEMPAATMWGALALGSGVLVLFPLFISARHPVAPGPTEPQPSGAGSPGRPPRATGLILCYTAFGFGYILPATYIPVLARQLVNDPNIFGWTWPLFGLAAALSTVLVSWGLKGAGRLRVWTVSHVLMAIGVGLPVVWHSITALAVAAVLVGGTFLVITMVAMQEARAQAQGQATLVLARMTAGFAFGQLLGPVVCGVLNQLTAQSPRALNEALELSTAALLLSAVYLWREDRCRQALVPARS